MYKIEFLINANCAVCCKDENEAKDFFEKCYNYGVVWTNGESLKGDFSEYVLTLNFPRCFHITNTSNKNILKSFLNIKCYVDNKFKIISSNEVEI